MLRFVVEASSLDDSPSYRRVPNNSITVSWTRNGRQAETPHGQLVSVSTDVLVVYDSSYKQSNKVLTNEKINFTTTLKGSLLLLPTS